MNYLHKNADRESRPYPIDRERRRRVIVALAEKDMTISGLARKLSVSKQYISAVINGRRLSEKTERHIAKFLGKPASYLFPERTTEEIKKMRHAELSQKSAAQKGKAA